MCRTDHIRAMYGFKQDLDLKSIVGKDLNLLGLGRYDLQLHFDGSDLKVICIQGKVDVRENDQVISSWNETNNWSSLNFQKLLNATASNFVIPHEKVLIISFENDLHLTLYDDAEQNEIAQFYWKDGKVTVV